MSKTATVRARIDPNLKEEAESILKTLGLNASESINLFYRMISLKKGIPFDLKIPNKKTIEAMKESTKGLKRQSLDEFIEEVNS